MDVLFSLWTFVAIIVCAFLVAWAAETAQFVVSQGMALAILAWLQTLPEFAVEAVIAWEAGKDPSRIHLITANFTGSIRLLIGFGWPMVYFISFFSHGFKKNGFRHIIKINQHHSIEILFLGLSVLTWMPFCVFRELNMLYGGILIIIYLFYLYILKNLPPEEDEELAGGIVSRIIKRGRKATVTASFIMFFSGGLGLYLVAEPFLHSMLKIAMALGISEFLFVQWVAPFLSEFPEKVSAFGWATREKTSRMGIINFVSSTVNQTSLLVGIIPFIYAISLSSSMPVVFDTKQIGEILLTLSQVFASVMILLDLEFSFSDALIMLVLWLVQFVLPSSRQVVMYLFTAWGCLELVKLYKGGFTGVSAFHSVLKHYVFNNEKK